MLLRAESVVENLKNLMAARTSRTWLASAIIASVAAHLVLGIGGRVILPRGEPAEDLVDVELAPAAPAVEALPEEKLRQEQEAAAAAAAKDEAPTPASTQPRPADDDYNGPMDASIDAVPDAAPDARPDARPKPDARSRPDAMLVAIPDDAADGSGSGSAEAVAESGSGSGSGSAEAVAADGSGSSQPLAVAETGSGSGRGQPLAVAVAETGSGTGSGTGVPSDITFGSGSSAGSATETAAAVDGAPTTAGTAANLLAYFPAGHVVTALVRFDRLRGTEWAALAEKILRPLPDYQVLFDPQHPPHLADKLDTLVISTPAPRDATATTLVAHTSITRAVLRDTLAAQFTWSPAKGGMLGRRAAPPNKDPRVVLAPFRGWFVLTQPANLTAPLLAASTGDLEKLEAAPRLLPPWLEGIRKIEAESGDPRGPALVVTIGGSAKRYKLPDVGLGVASIMAPARATIAAELVKQGWLVRGNIVFATEADAAEFVTALAQVQQRVSDSTLLKLALKRSHAVNALLGTTVSQSGVRVSYATSISIADARALLAVTAATLSDMYGAKP